MSEVFFWKSYDLSESFHRFDAVEPYSFKGPGFFSPGLGLRPTTGMTRRGPGAKEGQFSQRGDGFWGHLGEKV